MNTRKQGDLLENHINYELGSNKTRGSGSVRHDADLKDKELFVIECKTRKGKNLNIKKEWIDTVKKQAELSEREWLLINKTDGPDIYVTMDFNTFKELYKYYINFNNIT